MMVIFIPRIMANKSIMIILVTMKQVIITRPKAVPQLSPWHGAHFRRGSRSSY